MKFKFNAMKKNTFLLLLITTVFFLSSCDKEEFKEDLRAMALIGHNFETTNATSGSDVIYDSEGELKAHNLYEVWKFHSNGYIENITSGTNIGTYEQDLSEGTITISDGEFLGTHILNIGSDSFVFGISKDGEHYNVTFKKK